jgi:putative ATPase
VITALRAAQADAASAEPVPLHLRDTHYPGAKKLGHGKGYRYPHDFPGHTVDQEYRPAKFQGTRYYQPSDQGEEREDPASPP